LLVAGHFEITPFFGFTFIEHLIAPFWRKLNYKASFQKSLDFLVIRYIFIICET
jgi:hypothetical protein